MLETAIADALRLVAALDGAMLADADGLLAYECAAVRAEIKADPEAHAGLLGCFAALAWFAAGEVSELTGETNRDVLERVGAEIERLIRGGL
jgi:hypothetical protein